MTAKRPTPETLTLTAADGTRLVADHLPGEGTPLVFLHGLRSVRAGEKSTALFAFAQALGKPAWRFDFRGHGESGGELGEAKLSDHVADAATVLDRAGPSHVIGSSMGGLVAAWTAARHPGSVRSLTLLAPAFSFLERHFAGSAPRAGAPVTIYHDHEDGPLQLAPSVAEDLLAHDERELTDALRCPLLIAHGACDEVIPHTAARGVFDRLQGDGPRREFWLLPGEDHRLNQPIERILARAAAFHGY